MKASERNFSPSGMAKRSLQGENLHRTLLDLASMKPADIAGFFICMTVVASLGYVLMVIVLAAIG